MEVLPEGVQPAHRVPLGELQDDSTASVGGQLGEEVGQVGHVVDDVRGDRDVRHRVLGRDVGPASVDDRVRDAQPGRPGRQLGQHRGEGSTAISSPMLAASGSDAAPVPAPTSSTLPPSRKRLGDPRQGRPLGVGEGAIGPLGEARR